MGESDETITSRKSSEIVRLRLDGTNNAVNTLRDQQSSRGVSLVCPFPSLEVDLPVSFGEKGSEGMQRGSIHRIGVEDDPETGLPRLRLSIRTSDEQQIPAVISDSNEPIPLVLEVPTPALYDADPAWVNCFDVPMPEDLRDRVKTRRRHKIINSAAWIMAILAVVTGGYALQRTGYIDVAKVRSYISGFSMESFVGSSGDSRVADNGMPDNSLNASLSPVPRNIEPTALPPVAEQANQDSTGLEDVAPSTAEENETVLPVETLEQPEPMETNPTSATQEVALVTNEPAAVAAPNKGEQIELLLPTRWPVEYASGYRVRDPNGVVIDIPGGLVKREGWLDDLATHPMIRSIKSIQRETGARFLVRVNGALPRFMTAPKTDGVLLTLYYAEETEIGATERVAVAE